MNGNAARSALEDISQTTKVTVRSLQALEADAFDKLPGGILSKGIVRSYVRFSASTKASGWRASLTPADRKPKAQFLRKIGLPLR